MNIARLFSYTKELEKQLVETKETLSRQKHEFKQELNKLEERERLLIDKLLEKQGQRAVFDPKPQIKPSSQPPMKLPTISAREKAEEECKRLEIESLKTNQEIREAAKTYIQ